MAGASTALLLARAGVRVAVVERARRGVDTVSTHGLMRAGVLQLSRWGLLDRIVAAGTPPITRTVFHYSDGDQVQVSIRPSPGVDALYAPRRTVLDRILVEAAEEAGAVGAARHRGRLAAPCVRTAGCAARRPHCCSPGPAYGSRSSSARPGVDTVSTHGLMRAGVLQLSRWGLLDRIVAAGTPPITRTVFHYSDGDQVQVSIRPQSRRRRALRAATYRARPDPRRGSPRRRAPWSCTTPRSPPCSRGPDGRVRGVVAQDARGSRIELEAAITVGADGIRSVVAQQTGAPDDPPGECGERGALPLHPRTSTPPATSGRTATRAGRRTAAHQRPRHLRLRRDHARADAPPAAVRPRAGVRHPAHRRRPPRSSTACSTPWTGAR